MVALHLNSHWYSSNDYYTFALWYIQYVFEQNIETLEFHRSSDRGITIWLPVSKSGWVLTCLPPRCAEVCIDPCTYPK